jgi:hypothetical protein
LNRLYDRQLNGLGAVSCGECLGDCCRAGGAGAWHGRGPDLAGVVHTVPSMNFPESEAARPTMTRRSRPRLQVRIVAEQYQTGPRNRCFTMAVDKRLDGVKGVPTLFRLCVDPVPRQRQAAPVVLRQARNPPKPSLPWARHAASTKIRGDAAWGRSISSLNMRHRFTTDQGLVAVVGLLANISKSRSYATSAVRALAGYQQPTRWPVGTWSWLSRSLTPCQVRPSSRKSWMR